MIKSNIVLLLTAAEGNMDSSPNNQRTGLMEIMKNRSSTANASCKSYMSHYNTDQDKKELEAKRNKNYKEMTKSFYDIVTDFYEYGWSESFHFAPLNKNEGMEESLVKHEYRLGFRLGMAAGMKVLDIGCGIGGPARHLAEISGSNITGLNYNEYQIQRCRSITKQAGLDHLCTFVQGDFCSTPFEDNSFDAAYAIEATCHAPDRKLPFREAFRVLKPGGKLALYEWVVTKKFDKNNAQHKKIKNKIMLGNSLPDITLAKPVVDDLKAVGFEVITSEDLAETGVVPWYQPLAPNWSVSGFRASVFGRWCTHLMLTGMEKVGMVPKGSCDVHSMLCTAAEGLWLGGKEGIFTPLYFILARKPE